MASGAESRGSVRSQWRRRPRGRTPRSDGGKLCAWLGSMPCHPAGGSTSGLRQTARLVSSAEHRQMRCVWRAKHQTAPKVSHIRSRTGGIWLFSAELEVAKSVVKLWPTSGLTSVEFDRTQSGQPGPNWARVRRTSAMPNSSCIPNMCARFVAERFLANAACREKYHAA